MILIVASCVDEVAQRLLAELPQDSAQLLTPRDLSLPGWEVNSGSPVDSIYIASGRKLESRAISGVVCLLPRIFESELVHIEPVDRAYVASEMTAFLIFWLSSLPCPKLNPPTPGCMSGPYWPAERWLIEAASAGLPVKPLGRSTRCNSGPCQVPEECTTVTVAGQCCLGDDDPELGRHARSLASAVNVDLLEVSFVRDNASFWFSGADPFPELSQPGTTDAIWNFFTRGSLS